MENKENKETENTIETEETSDVAQEPKKKIKYNSESRKKTAAKKSIKTKEERLSKELKAIIDYANGYTYKEIEAKYGIDFDKMRYLIGTKRYSFIIKDRKKAIRNTIKKAFASVDTKYIELVNKYMDRLLDDERIDVTPLQALTNIIESLSNNYKKISEIKNIENRIRLENKRYELEKKQITLMLEQKYNIDETGKKETSIIESFYEQLKGLATPNIQNDNITVDELTEDSYTKQEMILDGKIAEVNRQLKEVNPKKYDIKKEPKDKKELKQKAISI